MWHNLKIKINEEIADFIWYNTDIQIGNSCVYSDSLFKCGLWTVSDLYEDNIMIPFKTWLKRGAQQSDYLLWRGLVTVVTKTNLPKIKTKILNVGLIETEKKNYLIDQVSEKQCKEGLRYTEYKSMNADDFKSKKRFETIHGAFSKDKWREIFILPRLCVVNNLIKDLQYKILHRFLPTNDLLFKMNKVVSRLCPFCFIHVDNLEHSIYECLIVKNFWHTVFNHWENVNHDMWVPDLQLITFGVFAPTKQRIGLNLLILLGKMFIFESKLNKCTLVLQDFQAFVDCNAVFLIEDPNTEKLRNFASV